MRILHVVPSLDQRYGGPLRAVLDLSARSIDLNLDAEILGFGPLSIPDNPFPREKIHELPIRFPRVYGFSPALGKWIARNLDRFDGVILHGMWLYPNWAFLKACRQAGVPYVCFPHGMLEPWALYRQGLFKRVKKTLYWMLRERAVFKHASAVFFTTERERKLAQETFALPPSSFVVVPYGVGGAVLLATEPSNPDLKIAAHRNVALFLGRVHPKKNVDFLIEAWALSRPDPNWLLMIAGPVEPQYQRRLEALTTRFQVHDQVRFVGSVAGRDKAYLLGRAAWFLLPSKQENFGIAVLEAINAGCPVAISDQVYLSDYFHEKSEVLPVRLDAWIEFLRQRMPDDRHRNALVRMDRECLIPKFSIDSVTRNWAATIREVFAAAGSQTAEEHYATHAHSRT
jgi:glycosyltransferase involved in cell wall biosynthesis